MYKFKINYGLEERIISDLMHDPSLVETYEIKPEWFNVLNFKAMYLSIAKYPAVVEYVEWLGEAKNNGFQGEFDELKKIYDDYMTVYDLKRLVTTLKREYLNNLFNDDIKTAQTNPTSDNQTKCMDTLSKIRHIGMENSDGDLSDTTDNIIDSLYHPKPLGIKVTDYPRFNKIFGGGMSAGLHIIGANTGVGKTSFVINLIKKIMLDPTIHIDLFSCEMSQEENELRLISSMTGINSYILRDPYNRIKKDSVRKYVEQTAQNIKKSNLHIYAKNNDLNTIINTMKDNASMLKTGDYKYIAFIDYIGLVEVENVDQRYLALGKITRALKNFSNDYQAPIVALTQLNRAIEQRDDKHPKLSDIRESGNVSQDANTVCFLSEAPESNDDTKIIDLNVAKNRNGELSLIKYGFDGKRMKISEVDN